jgi:AraC family transcriptional regulator
LRHRVLFEDDELRVLSTLYAPSAVFKPHRDDLSRITMTLGGSVAEEARPGSALISSGDVLLKSRTAVHENRYAPGGALQVAIEFLCEEGDGALGRVLEDVWSLRRGADALRHALAALEAAAAKDGVALRAAATDMTAAIADAPLRDPSPPRWLWALKEDLEQAGLSGVDIAARARQAGVHPVHASRLFRACYGVSITCHAQLHAVRRAIGELAAGANLCAAAAAAGFYDQSHMSRVFRRVTGRTPGAHRKVWAGAAC